MNEFNAQTAIDALYKQAVSGQESNVLIAWGAGDDLYTCNYRDGSGLEVSHLLDGTMLVQAFNEYGETGAGVVFLPSQVSEDDSAAFPVQG